MGFKRILFVIASLWLPLAAEAQDRRLSHCIAVAENLPGARYIQLASLGTPPADEFTVRITYIDHSMFLIQTPAGQDIVTDYNGFIGATQMQPDIVTMNNAHGSHWTAFPDPNIPHVLEGWRQQGEPADHYLEFDDLLIRNVTTDIRGRDLGTRIRDNNSIFIFEVAGLCIGHLGHLHHEPTEAQYAAIGRLDVVMAAVDGGLTVDLPTMSKIVGRLKSSIVIPMHWWSPFSLERFVTAVGSDFAVENSGQRSIEVSLRTLPDRPTVVVLQPRFLRVEDE